MKFLHTVHQFRKGIRLHSFVLAVLMTWAMLCSIVVFGRVQYYSSDIAALSTEDLETSYLLLGSYTHASESALVEENLLAHPDVKAAYSMQKVAGVLCNGVSVNVLLYQPEMLEALPGLKALGIDFSADPNGAIIGNFAVSGKEITLSSEKGEDVFSVAGHLASPYRYFSLAEQYTNFALYSFEVPLVHLFKDDPVIILPQTEEVMSKISQIAPYMEHGGSLFVRLQPGLTQEEQAALLTKASTIDKYPRTKEYPLSQLVDEALAQRSTTLKMELPQPLLLAITAMVSYLSMTVLILQKKQPALGQLYLCGASRRRCGAVVFAAIQRICLFPVLLGTAFVLIWPQLYWPALSPLNIAVKGHFVQWLYQHPGLRAFWESIYQFLGSTVLIQPACLWVVLGYWLLTVAISLLITIGFMKRNTPITSLKGAQQ